MKRSQYVDALKGFAILLVVLGHAAQRNTAFLPHAPWVSALFSFGQWHMVLFMAISGYLAFGRVPASAGPWLARKARMLLVPYFAWTFAYYWVADAFISKAGGFWTYAKAAVTTPANTFWFFYVLFLCYACLVLVERIGVWGVVPVGLIVTALPYTAFGIDLLGWYWWWFAAGYVFAASPAKFRDARTIGWAAAVAAYAALVWLAPESSLPVRIGWGLSGIGVATGLVAVASRTPVRAALAHLGRRTFVLYPAEFLFFLLPLPASMWRVPVYTVLAIAGGLALDVVLRMTPPTRLLFLGDRPGATYGISTAMAPRGITDEVSPAPEPEPEPQAA